MWWTLLVFEALCARPRVAVVVSDALAPYEEPVDAFTAALDEPVTVIHLRGNEAEAEAAVRKLQHERPEVIFALGAKAAWSMKGAFPQIPLVYASVRDPVRYGIEGRQVTGISTDVSPITYLSQFASFFPSAKRIGLLTGPETPEQQLGAVREAVAVVGMQLEVIEVEHPRRVRRAIVEASSRIDALWIRPDRQLLTRDSFRAAVDETRRRRLPLLVETDNMVRAGGLFAVVPSADGVGRQAASVVRQLLDGAAPSVIAVQEPAEVSVALNLRTLELSEIVFDELLLDFVDEVVE